MIASFFRFVSDHAKGALTRPMQALLIKVLREIMRLPLLPCNAKHQRGFPGETYPVLSSGGWLFLRQATAIERSIPQPIIAGKTPNKGGKVKLNLQPVNRPGTPRIRKTSPNTKAGTAQNLSNEVIMGSPPLSQQWGLKK
jgi:hypothetical protein